MFMELGILWLRRPEEVRKTASSGAAYLFSAHSLLIPSYPLMSLHGTIKMREKGRSQAGTPMNPPGRGWSLATVAED
jgi:hypothetical protein